MIQISIFMKALKYILIVLLVLVAIFLILALIAPKDTKVERSVVIKAPKELIMEHVANYKNFALWSPWQDYDPNMKTTFEGEDGTVGSKMMWEGNDSVGTGMQEITAISENRVEQLVTFIKPWESKANAYFDFAPEAEGIKVTWGFTSSTPFPMNIMNLFFDIDEYVGKDYEKGLNKLKEVCESKASMPKLYRGYSINETEMANKTYVGIRKEVAFADMKAYFAEAYQTIGAGLGAAGLSDKIAGPPCAIYYKWDVEGGKADLMACFPVAGEIDMAKLKGMSMQNAGGKALTIAYMGNYDNMEQAHYGMDDYMKEKSMELNEVVLEEYVTDPGNEPDTAKWLTNIYYFVK